MYRCKVDDFNQTVIVGHAYDILGLNKPIIVELYYNDLFIAKTIANIPRDDKYAKLHTLRCGFVFYLTEELYNLFTDKSLLSIRLPDEKHYAFDGTTISTPVQQFDDTGLKVLREKLSSGLIINKWGNFIDDTYFNNIASEKLLATYSKLSKIFEDTFGSPLWITYGSLLGFARNGEMIPWDDDLDVGYFSEAQTIIEFKKDFEYKVQKLQSLGYDVISNATGQMFWVDSENGGYLDIFGSWQDASGRFTMVFAMDCWNGKEMLFPLTEKSFSGVQCMFPNDIEKFVKQIYGNDWKIPDKNFSWNNNILEAKFIRTIILRNSNSIEDAVALAEEYGYKIADLFEKLEILNNKYNDLVYTFNNQSLELFKTIQKIKGNITD